MTDPANDGLASFEQDVTAVLILADGMLFRGAGLGCTGKVVGEVCFNTAMTGYQEILTDPSYAGQIITFTFPHIGNVGTNDEDIEAISPAARGFVLRETITPPSNIRSQRHFDDWARDNGLVGIAGVDTRRLTRHIRLHGAPNGVLVHAPDGNFDLPDLLEEAQAWPGLEGMDLAKEVTTDRCYSLDEGKWRLGDGYQKPGKPRFHVVAVDYGIKRNILRCLASFRAQVTVVPCTTTAAEILELKPDGIFLSNGPGDPAATGEYAIPELQALIAYSPVCWYMRPTEISTFRICSKKPRPGQGLKAWIWPRKSQPIVVIRLMKVSGGLATVIKNPANPVSTSWRSITGSSETFCDVWPALERK